MAHAASVFAWVCRNTAFSVFLSFCLSLPLSLSLSFSFSLIASSEFNSDRKWSENSIRTQSESPQTKPNSAESTSSKPFFYGWEKRHEIKTRGKNMSITAALASHTARVAVIHSKHNTVARFCVVKSKLTLGEHSTSSSPSRAHHRRHSQSNIKYIMHTNWETKRFYERSQIDNERRNGGTTAAKNLICEKYTE